MDRNRKNTFATSGASFKSYWRSPVGVVIRIVLALITMGLLFKVFVEAGERTGTQSESAKQAAIENSEGKEGSGGAHQSAPMDEDVPAKVPDCGSAQAREMLESIIEDQHLKLLDLYSTAEVIYDPTNDVRYCQATSILSSGIQPVAFRFFPKSDKSGFLLEVRPMIPTAWGGVNPWVLTGEITEIQSKLSEKKRAAAGTPPPGAIWSGWSGKRIEEVKAAIVDCIAKTSGSSGELKHFVADANCSNPRILEGFQKTRYPYMDLVQQLTAKRLEVAEKMDAGEITEGEGQLEISKFETYLDGLERARRARPPKN
jgi:hypothetical protein